MMKRLLTFAQEATAFRLQWGDGELSIFVGWLWIAGPLLIWSLA